MLIAFEHSSPVNCTLGEALGDNIPIYGFFCTASEGEKISYRTLEAFAC